jgi:hypothetical protein
MLKNYKKSKWNRRHGGEALAKLADSPERTAILQMFDETNVKKLLGLLMKDAQKGKPDITVEAARIAAINKLKPFYDAFKEPPYTEFDTQIEASSKASMGQVKGLAYKFSQEQPIDLLKLANELQF